MAFPRVTIQRVFWWTVAVAGISVATAAAGIVALMLLSPCFDCKQHAHNDAKVLASAVALYRSEHDDCPTPDDLRAEKIMDPRKNTRDEWGSEFRIECEVDGATVTSAGPDKTFGTADDLH
jgi:hypothetical protein